jgi:nucleotide-binding universal stress UspA family protein
MSLVASSIELGLKSVLVATDFSKASEKPLRHALAIARHYGAKFYLANVVSSPAFTLAGPEVVRAAVDAAERDARRLEDALVQDGSLSSLRHEVIVRQGDLWEQLEDVIRQQDIDLVVVGTHGRRGFSKLLLGSVAERIFRNANCLVLTVGPCSFDESPVGGVSAIRPFLFTTDFSQASLQALPFAISSANHFGAQLVLLHVVPAFPAQDASHHPNAGDLLKVRDEIRIASLRGLHRLISQNAPLTRKPEFLVEFGSPSETILQTAETIQADAIILGLHRLAYIATACHMPWATAYEVVCGARCPVLTVRSDPETRAYA